MIYLDSSSNKDKKIPENGEGEANTGIHNPTLVTCD
jgi:hypothetical protein